MKLCPTCHQPFPDEEINCPQDGGRLRQDPLLGSTLSTYRVTGWLGEGGMGVLYRAEHESIRRKAAVKVIRQQYVADEKAVARFEFEARAVSSIGDPHLIDIFDIGYTPDGRLYYVMELLEGRSLSARQEEERLDFRGFTTIVVDACHALEAAHALHIVHRDLKPDNLFLVERPGEPPFVKVLDFGIAKVVGLDGEQAGQQLTKAGSIIGTPQYMAPEQIRGEVDARTDIYAMGVILYQLSVGRLPFEDTTLNALLLAHVSQPPPRFASLAGARLADGLPPGMEAVVMRALAKNPDERYPSVGELRADLERLLARGEPLAQQWWESHRQPAPSAERPTLIAPLPVVLPAQGAIGTTSTAHVEPARSSRVVWVVAAAALAMAAVAITRLVLVPKPPIVVVPPPTPSPSPLPLPPPRRPDLLELRDRALGVLAQRLAAGDWNTRQQAAAAYGGGRDFRHHTLIERLLDDAEPAVQSAAADALDRLGAKESAPSLRQVLGRNAEVDPHLARPLARLGTDADRRQSIEQLRRGMRHGADAGRLEAALVLLELDDAEAHRVLARAMDKLLGTGAPSGERAIAGARVAASLARAGDDRARAALFELLDAGDPAVRLRAAIELANLGEERARRLLSEMAESRTSTLSLDAYVALATLQDESGFDTFAAILGEARSAPADRLRAVEGMAAMKGGEALDLVAPLVLADDTPLALSTAAAGAVLSLAASDRRVMAEISMAWAAAARGDSSALERLAAALVMGASSDPNAVPMLAVLTHDQDAEVRRVAVEALRSHEGAEATAALQSALADTVGAVRLAAARALASSTDKAALPIVERYAEAAEGTEQVVAAGLLMKRGRSEQRGRLLTALRSKRPEERLAALEALASGSEPVTDELVAALSDSSSAVRLLAARLLAERGRPDGAQVLQRAVKKGGAEAVSALGALARLQIEPAAKVDAAQLLGSRDRKVRRAAVDEAARLAPAQALAVFRRAVRDRDATIRLATVGHLGELAGAPGGEPAIELLRVATLDRDSGVRARAEAVLSRLQIKEPAHRTGRRGPAGTSLAPRDDSPPPPAPPAPSPAPSVAAPPADMMVPPDLRSSVSAADREQAELAQMGAESLMGAGRWSDALRELRRAQKLNPQLNLWSDFGDVHRQLAMRADTPAAKRAEYQLAIDAYGRLNNDKGRSFRDELQQLLESEP